MQKEGGLVVGDDRDGYAGSADVPVHDLHAHADAVDDLRCRVADVQDRVRLGDVRRRQSAVDGEVVQRHGHRLVLGHAQVPLAVARASPSLGRHDARQEHVARTHGH